MEPLAFRPGVPVTAVVALLALAVATQGAESPNRKAAIVNAARG